MTQVLVLLLIWALLGVDSNTIIQLLSITYFIIHTAVENKYEDALEWVCDGEDVRKDEEVFTHVE